MSNTFSLCLQETPPPRPASPMAAATPASSAMPPRSAGARAGSSAASSAKSAGKSAAHKSPAGHVELSPRSAPVGNPVTSAPAVTPTTAPKPPAARRHLTNRDGALERVLQLKARAGGAANKAASSAPAHSVHDLPARRGGSSTQNASISHATAAGSGQTAHGHQPVQSQIGDHKGRQALTQPASVVPQSGDATFIQRMLAHGLSHQVQAAGHPKSHHPKSGPGITGLK